MAFTLCLALVPRILPTYFIRLNVRVEHKPETLRLCAVNNKNYNVSAGFISIELTEGGLLIKRLAYNS